MQKRRQSRSAETYEVANRQLDDRRFLEACRDFPGSPAAIPLCLLRPAFVGGRKRASRRQTVRSTQRCRLFRDRLTNLARTAIFLTTSRLSPAPSVGVKRLPEPRGTRTLQARGERLRPNAKLLLAAWRRWCNDAWCPSPPME